jgi:hypothetical protein
MLQIRIMIEPTIQFFDFPFSNISAALISLSSITLLGIIFNANIIPNGTMITSSKLFHLYKLSKVQIFVVLILSPKSYLLVQTVIEKNMYAMIIVFDNHHRGRKDVMFLFSSVYYSSSAIGLRLWNENDRLLH